MPTSALQTAPKGGFIGIGAYGPGGGKARAARWRGLFALAFLAIAGCDSTPPEQKLRDTIAQMQADGEAKKVSAVMDVVAEDFVGRGTMDKQQLQRFLTLVALQNAELGVTTGPVEVEVMGERARATFTLGASGGAAGRWLPDRAQVYEVTTGWRMEGGDWKLVSADWDEQL